MDLRSKILISVVAGAIIFVVCFKYVQFSFNRDFTLITYLPCDPVTDGTCFYTPCEGDECESVWMFADGSPYKKVSILASHAPACMFDGGTKCSDFVCDPDDETCSITYCSDETLEEGEACLYDEADTTTESNRNQ